MSDDMNNEPNSTQGDPEALGDAGKRALDAERTARAAAEKRVRELEQQIEQVTATHAAAIEALQGEIETTNAAKAEAEQATEAARLDAIRYRVGLRAGLPETVIDRLRGTDETEIEADAASFAEVFKSSGTAIPSPSPDPSQGARGSSGSETTADQFAQFVKGQI